MAYDMSFWNDCLPKLHSFPIIAKNLVQDPILLLVPLLPPPPGRE